MSQDFFENLPSEITFNILSRLPTRTTMRCKCVCKPWLELLTTPEFVKSHLSKSIPALAMFEIEAHSKPYKIAEFVEEGDDDDEHHWNIVFNFDLPFNEPLHSSVNGLLFLCSQGTHPRHPCDLYLCNPITREYISLPSPRQPASAPMFLVETFGFGVSKTSGQHKVVRVFREGLLRKPFLPKCDEFECQVYTVGTGFWRRIASVTPLKYVDDTAGAFLNGNLHFLASIGCSYRISCLDLETETFSIFSPPPLEDPYKCRNLSVLKDCLCVCDNSADWYTSDDEIDIWLMKEYGDVKSWTKDFIIRKVDRDDFLGFLRPVKVFEDGGILLELVCKRLMYYSGKTKTIRRVDLSGFDRSILGCTAIYAPSFLPLKTFGIENVSSF